MQRTLEDVGDMAKLNQAEIFGKPSPEGWVVQLTSPKLGSESLF
jgi:hypothetical protein